MAVRGEVYKDEAGEWRWKMLAGNNKTVADSSEGYKRKSSAEAALKLVLDAERGEEEEGEEPTRPPIPQDTPVPEPQGPAPTPGPTTGTLMDARPLPPGIALGT